MFASLAAMLCSPGRCGPVGGGRNLIFSLEMLPEAERSPELARMRERYARLEPILARERAKLLFG